MQNNYKIGGPYIPFVGFSALIFPSNQFWNLQFHNFGVYIKDLYKILLWNKISSPCKKLKLNLGKTMKIYFLMFLNSIIIASTNQYPKETLKNHYFYIHNLLNQLTQIKNKKKFYIVLLWIYIFFLLFLSIKNMSRISHFSSCIPYRR